MERTTLKAIGDFAAKRKRELGIVGDAFIPLNPGDRRTESKRQLLRAIADEARASGREPRFKANIGEG